VREMGRQAWRFPPTSLIRTGPRPDREKQTAISNGSTFSSQCRRCQPQALHRAVRALLAAPHRPQPGQHAQRHLGSGSSHVRGKRGAPLSISAASRIGAPPRICCLCCLQGRHAQLFARTMALGACGSRIRVNAIAPDYTITRACAATSRACQPRVVDSTHGEQDDATARRIPLGRAGIDTEAAMSQCSCLPR